MGEVLCAGAKKETIKEWESRIREISQAKRSGLTRKPLLFAGCVCYFVREKEARAHFEVAKPRSDTL